jgi:prepilin-type processing-associated H-X9-DG protein
MPACHHNGAGGLSFADGHAEIKKWRDGQVLKYGRNGVANDSGNFQPQDLTSHDLQWLQDLTTAKQ